MFIQSATNWDISVAVLGKILHMARLRLASTHLFFFHPVTYLESPFFFRFLEESGEVEESGHYVRRVQRERR